MTEKAAVNAPIDVQDLYARFSIDAASDSLFGKNLDTLSGRLPTPGSGWEHGSLTDDAWGTFVQAFQAMQHINTARVRMGLIWPLFELFHDNAAPHMEVIRQWLDPLVRHALEEKSAVRKAGIERKVGEKTFLEHLADSTEGDFCASEMSSYVILYRHRKNSRPTP